MIRGQEPGAVDVDGQVARAHSMTGRSVMFRGGDGMLDSLSGRSRHHGEVFEGAAQARGGEWLEERRTGVPSRRGERYARYTDEQKRAAVDHCLTHGRRSGGTMRRMGYPSHEVLAAWTGRAGARGARDRTRPGGGRGRAYGGGAAGRGRCDVAAGRGRGGRGGVGRGKPEASTAARAGIGGRSGDTGQAGEGE